MFSLMFVYNLCVCVRSTQQEVDCAAGSPDVSREEPTRNTASSSASSSSSSSTYFSYSSSLVRQTQADTEESRPLLDVNRNDLSGIGEYRKPTHTFFFGDFLLYAASSTLSEAKKNFAVTKLKIFLFQ